MGSENNQPGKEQDDPKVLGELILNSPLWIVFRTDNKGSYMHSNKPDAMVLVAEYFCNNRDDWEKLKQYVFEKTKFHIS